MGRSIDQPTDGKGKAPPSVGRMWLVGFMFFDIANSYAAGGTTRNTNVVNISSASRDISCADTCHERA
jgi:hypothetical protein